MGNTSSQLEPYPEIPDDFGDSVPETPNPSKVGGTKKKNKKATSSETKALSPAIAEAHGTGRSPELDSNMSNSSKRKRDPEPERKKKTKKPRKSEKSVAQSPSPERSSPHLSVQIPYTPSQPTPSKPKSSSKKVHKQNGENLNMPTSSTAQCDPYLTVAEEPSAVKRLAVTKRTPTTDSNTEGSTTPGGKAKRVRSSRTREKDKKKIGFFTPDEVEKLEAYKLDFCTIHGIPTTRFDEMVQHSERNANESPLFSDICKGDFYDDIYALLPDRDRRSVYRFMRRHFQASAQRAHDWSKEQDDELIALHAKHGPKWTFIGKLIGRSDDDVTQRWKNKLEHQNTMNRGAWSEEETKMFLDAVKSTWVTMKPMLADEAGKDMYELDERLIVWGNISKEMGHVRSRQQCADKWRKIVKQVMVSRANGQPDAGFDFKLAAKKSARWNMRLESQKKSSQFVNEDSDEDMTTTNPSLKPHDETAPTSIVNANAESDEAQSEEGEPDLSEPLKNNTKSKSKRKHNEDSASDPIEKALSSPDASKKSKEERKREKKERREKKRQEKEKREQIEQEVQEDKAARKEQKRKRREEKKRRILEEERLAAEEANKASGSGKSPKEKQKFKKQKQASIDSPSSLPKPSSHSVVEESPSPASPASHISATEHDATEHDTTEHDTTEHDATEQDDVVDEYDSDGGDEDSSEIYLKYETDSDEL